MLPAVGNSSLGCIYPGFSVSYPYSAGGRRGGYDLSSPGRQHAGMLFLMCCLQQSTRKKTEAASSHPVQKPTDSLPQELTKKHNCPRTYQLSISACVCVCAHTCTHTRAGASVWVHRCMHVSGDSQQLQLLLLSFHSSSFV